MTPAGLSLLFTPLNVGGLWFKNRLVALPVYTGYAHPGGRISRLMMEHYARLARSGVAMVVVANAAVSENGILSDYNLRIDRDEFIPGLAKLAKSIQARGALACLQLNHGGRFAKTARPLLPSAITGANLAFNVGSLKDFMNFFPFEKRTGLTRRFIAMASSWSRAMSAAERRATIADFGKAARRAWEAGFDLIELHGAGGYLICQFLSSFSNKQGQDHGQAFLLDLLKEVKQNLPQGFPIGYRLITREFVPGGIEIADALALAKALEKENIAYLSASVGTYNSMFSETAREKMDQVGYLQADVASLTRATRLPTIISGRIATPELAHTILAAGNASLIGLGRVLRTDPRWVFKAGDPAANKIIACLNCHWCLKRVVLEEGFNCKRWPKQVQEKTDLEHRLLSRNYRGLLIAATPDDLLRLQLVLTHLLPQRRTIQTSISPTLLILRTIPAGRDPAYVPKGNAMPAEMDQAVSAFMAASHQLLAQAGFADSTIEKVERTPAEPLDQEIYQQAINGNNGLIIIPQNPGQPWRNKVAVRARKRVVILVGRQANISKILVPIDMSLSSLLVLLFIQQAFGRRENLDFHFVHIRSTSEDRADTHLIEKRWHKMKSLAGLKPDTALQVKPSNGQVADALVKILKMEGFDTIIMGRRGISRMKYLLMGSVSGGVLRQLTHETLMVID
jgi:2,4-dienoyl-CoA reductase-like NADH-dependent reductase (Old Yellow Enzyme family)/nucleotide-binding universal stress UspA family protein